MNAVIYARYSSDNQREESIEGQIRECMAYAALNGIKIIDSYVDRAFSAKTDQRPSFQKMIKDSAKKLFDTVLVWKLDRFARDRYDSAHYKNTLKKNGVKVISATERISDGPEGIILESVLEGMAEYYSVELSEKVTRGHTENALKCKCNGGTIAFGLTLDKEHHYIPDPLTAPIVLEVYQRYAAGETLKQLVDDLDKRQIKGVKGNKIGIDTLNRILSNRKYIGEYKYHDIVVPDGIPAIVPEDLFNEVQEMKAKNKKAPARRKAEDLYILATKLFCGRCGTAMDGECGHSANGNRYSYYKCLSAKRK
ncbi:MAG: recombinase family protein [Oscillospiraceae bacterium]|nr:recombinase family protein [Oscillospiraceae bacterium]